MSENRTSVVGTDKLRWQGSLGRRRGAARDAFAFSASAAGRHLCASSGPTARRQVRCSRATDPSRRSQPRRRGREPGRGLGVADLGGRVQNRVSVRAGQHRVALRTGGSPTRRIDRGGRGPEDAHRRAGPCTLSQRFEGRGAVAPSSGLHRGDIPMGKAPNLAQRTVLAAVGLGGDCDAPASAQRAGSHAARLPRMMPPSPMPCGAGRRASAPSVSALRSWHGLPCPTRRQIPLVFPALDADHRASVGSDERPEQARGNRRARKPEPLRSRGSLMIHVEPSSRAGSPRSMPSGRRCAGGVQALPNRARCPRQGPGHDDQPGGCGGNGHESSPRGMPDRPA